MRRRKEADGGEEAQDETEFEQDEGEEPEDDDAEDANGNEEEEEPDDEQADAEPSNLVFESRFRPMSRGDLEFDEDAMYSTWGPEAFRMAKEVNEDKTRWGAGTRTTRNPRPRTRTSGAASGRVSGTDARSIGGADGRQEPSHPGDAAGGFGCADGLQLRDRGSCWRSPVPSGAGQWCCAEPHSNVLCRTTKKE